MKDKINPLEILKDVSILEENDIPTDIDEIVLENCKKVSKRDYKQMIEILYDVVILMRDPRNIVPLLNSLVDSSNTLHSSINPLYVYKFIYFLMKNYDFSFDNFYLDLYNCINIKNIEEDYESFLFFIVTVFENKEISMKVGKSYVKLLLQLSLQTKSKITLSILYSVLLIIRLHPSLYKMALPGEHREFGTISETKISRITSFETLEIEEYLFELDIHEESIECISKICKTIKREAQCKNTRPKFVNLNGVKYPSIKY